MCGKIKQPLNSEELATLDKSAAALIKARTLIQQNCKCGGQINEVIAEIWMVLDAAKHPATLV